MNYATLNKDQKNTYLLELFEKVRHVYPIYQQLYHVLATTPPPSEEFMDTCYQRIKAIKQTQTISKITGNSQLLETIHQHEQTELDQLGSIEDILADIE